jgi:sugar (pentulose or hexulose) kinase
MAILGIDLGTSSVKVIILDTQGHTVSTGKAGCQQRGNKPISSVVYVSFACFTAHQFVQFSPDIRKTIYIC